LGHFLEIEVVEAALEIPKAAEGIRLFELFECKDVLVRLPISCEKVKPLDLTKLADGTHLTGNTNLIIPVSC